MILIFKYFVILLIFVYSTILLGSFIAFIVGINFPTKQDYFSIFIKILLGLLTIVLTISLFKTNFKTINTGLIVSSVLYRLTFRRQKAVRKFHYKISSNNIFLITIITVLIFLFQLYSILVDFTPTFVIPSGDYSFYSAISEQINFMGFETTHFFPSEFKEYYGFEPYHYFESWISIFNFSLFNINPLLSFWLISISSIIIACFFMILSFFENFNYHSKIIYPLSLVFLFYSSFEFYPNDLINFLGVGFGKSFMLPMQMKFTVHFLMFGTAIVFFFKERFNMFFLIFIATIFVCPDTIPIVSISSVFIIIYLYILKKNRQQSIKRLIFVFGSIIFWIIIYKLNSYSSPNSNNIINNFGILDLATLKTRINIFGKSFLIIIISYFPNILCFFLIYKFLPFKFSSKFSNIVNINLIIILSGIISWIIFFQNFDAVQFLQISSIFLNSTLVFFSTFIIAHFYNSVLPKSKLFFVLTIVSTISLINIIYVFHIKFEQKKGEIGIQKSKVYLDEISKITIDNPIGTYITKTSKEDRISARLSPSYFLGYNYIPFNRNLISTINIGIYDTKIDTSDKTEINNFARVLERNPFHVYMKKNTLTEIKESQRAFIKNFQIEYLITSKEIILGDEWSPLIDTVIADKKTGEKFYKLITK